jgi:hypothetical protein
LTAIGPAKVPDRAIAELKGRERNGLVELPPPPGFHRGDTVRITRGILTGRLALFEGQRPHERVAVLLQLLGRVELPKGASITRTTSRPASLADVLQLSDNRLHGLPLGAIAVLACRGGE